MVFFVLTIKVFPSSLGLICSLQPHWSWGGIPLVAHLFGGGSVQIPTLGMPVVLERGRCAGSGSHHAPAVPGSCRRRAVSSWGWEAAGCGGAAERAIPRESPWKQSLCTGCAPERAVTVHPCRSSPGAVPAPPAKRGDGHRPPSMKPCFITGLAGGCFMLCNDCSHFSSSFNHSFCA